MNSTNLQRQFARMGAGVVIDRSSGRTTVDVNRSRRGSAFVIGLPAGVQANVLDVQPRQRHLVLQLDGRSTFLCGHDERDWFAAAVPSAGSVTSVRAAMEALKPRAVRQAQLEKRVKRQHRNRRRNAAFIRQGEWFFLPAPGLVVNDLTVLHNEPLIRGRGKPHMAEHLVRTGGEVTYVCREYPRGLSAEAYARLISRRPAKAQLAWQVLRRNPLVYVRGSIRHPDHKTIHLDVWHRVLANTEHESPAMRNLVFID